MPTEREERRQVMRVAGRAAGYWAILTAVLVTIGLGILEVIQ